MAIIIFDIDGVVRDVGGSYRRALADTVEKFTDGAYRPTMEDIDQLKSEGIWNNDWEGSQELIYRYFESQGQTREQIKLDYDQLVIFFQSKYRGEEPGTFGGYITTEPLLLQPSYLEELTSGEIIWGFFSGATRDSAEYVLRKRLCLPKPVLIAMEDAPGKPDPTGLFKTLSLLETIHGDLGTTPVIYVGDTVADMYTVVKAREIKPERIWLGVGILPPHVHGNEEREKSYGEALLKAGAAVVFANVQELNSAQVSQLLSTDR